MPPILIARPGVEPVSLAEAKAHLRLEGSDEDALVAGLVSAARAFVQGTTRLCLIAQTWRIAAPGWPPGRAIALPVAPVLAVGAVRIGTAGGPVLLPETAWSLDEGADPARIVAADDAPDPT
ncbi:MAG: phage head-tail connector protein, partial [Methylobacteriaceae bacterium]|nr:phage head-tail connector protein [Methylobacteriaceae bacterium]